MRLTTLHVRFFRSFNYDFERKDRGLTQALSWEETEPAWHPFVRVPIERDITAVVGANESGKSQLLVAIKAVLTGEPIERADFCRYSELYSVKAGEVRKPEFGGTFEVESGELEHIAPLAETTQVSLFRPGGGTPFVVVDDRKIQLSDQELKDFLASIPKYQELQTTLAIPNSVSIRRMAGANQTPLHDRGRRGQLVDSLETLINQPAAAVGKALAPLLSTSDEVTSTRDAKRREAEFELARQLLVSIAGVEVAEFKELSQAIEDEREGQVAAIIGGINAAIRENLNIQRWWTQDREFDLLVEAREHELVFTIQDKTESRYSFRERSQGLRYFLSYFVQLRAHRLENKRPDILLLDEPDAFLSSVGQQDLLRVLHEYAHPEGDLPRSQVIYVTHSPFLIDKNAPHRIRVLDKGAEDEGTRVVNDAANNRYEPLRSALGASVAETAFIGGKNLFVEGLADQTLLTGVATHIVQAKGAEAASLNLNEVTVVASGGADGVPYLVYLARGRDSVKPACVALFDGDKAGHDAARVLIKGEARKRRVLKEEHIVLLDQWAKEAQIKTNEGGEVLEIEDLIPVEVAHKAALNHLARFIDLASAPITKFTPELIREQLAKGNGRLSTAVGEAYTASFPNEHIEKVGFAREVISLLDSDPSNRDTQRLLENFSSLLDHLSTVLDDAQEEEETRRTDDRLKRIVKNFLSDYTEGMKKSAAVRLLRSIDGALGNSDFGDDLRLELSALERDFELKDLTVPKVANFSDFKERISAFSRKERLAYQDDATRNPAAIALEADDQRDVSDHSHENGLGGSEVQGRTAATS